MYLIEVIYFDLFNKIVPLQNFNLGKGVLSSRAGRIFQNCAKMRDIYSLSYLILSISMGIYFRRIVCIKLNQLYVMARISVLLLYTVDVNDPYFRFLSHDFKYFQ